MDPYDKQLTYEQRAELRRQIRKEKLETSSYHVTNGNSTPEDDDDDDFSTAKISRVLVKQLTSPSLENGVVGKPSIVTVNGNGVTKNSSSGSEEFDIDASPNSLYNETTDSIDGITPEGKSLPNIKEAWCNSNDNSTSDISELSIPDSLLCEMGSDAVLFSNTSTNSSVTADNLIRHPVVTHISNGTKQRCKSESPTSSLKRKSRKASAPDLSVSVSMEISNVEDDDVGVENFSLQRSKYAPIRRKRQLRHSVSGSCPSLNAGEKPFDVGPMPQLLGRLEETGETDGSLKSSPEPHKEASSNAQSTPSNATQAMRTIVDTCADEVDKPISLPEAKQKDGVITSEKPPLAMKKSDSGGIKQKKKSVKGMLFPSKLSSNSPNEHVVEPGKEATAVKPKVKKAARRISLGGFMSRLSPKREVPTQTTDKPSSIKKNESTRQQPRKISLAKNRSHSSSSLSKKPSDSSFKSQTGKFQGQKSSSFIVSKEPLKTSVSQSSFASRDASNSVESLLSDGSTDILLAHSSHDLFCSSSREDLLDDPMLSLQPSDERLSPTGKLEEVDASGDQQDMGPSPVILLSSPVKDCQNKRMVTVKGASGDIDTGLTQDNLNNLYRAKSMEALDSTSLLTEVEVMTSITPASNLASTVSVSTENLTSSVGKKKGGITISTVKKCNSLDILAVSKHPVPASTVTVLSKRTPTKSTPLATTAHKVDDIKGGVTETSASVGVSDKQPVKAGAVVSKDETGSDKIGHVTSPAMTRQGSGRKVSTASSPFRRSNSRSSIDRKRSTAVGASPTHGQNVDARKTVSPAKKTTITIKSTKINITPVKKVSAVGSTPTSAKSSDSVSSSGGLKRTVSPTKSSLRRSSMQRISGRKKSTGNTPPSSVVSSSPSPAPTKVPFMSLFPEAGGKAINRVSSDEAPVNSANKSDIVHVRSSSEVISSSSMAAPSGLTDIEEHQPLTTSVETLRIPSSMSDSACLQNSLSTETPVRRISSGPTLNKATTGSQSRSQALPVLQTAVRRKSSVRPQTARLERSAITQQYSDSSLKRPSSAATRRASSTMRPSGSGTLPRTLSKTKSDSKISFSTLPRVRKVTESGVAPETSFRRPVRPLSAAVSRGGGSQVTARSFARRISLAPTSSAGRFTRSSVAQRSKSTVTPPDINLITPSEGSKTSLDETDGAKMSTTTHSLLGDVRPKGQDTAGRRTSTATRSSFRRISTANKPADSDNLKDARQSIVRTSRRSSRHTVITKSASAVTPNTLSVNHITPNRKLSIDRRTGSGSSFLTPKQEPSLSMSDLDAVKSADRLQSSNHRRFVRPKLRQKPSHDHLKQLMDRADITSDISPDLNSKKKPRVDPNMYSTYMGKKNLAASAVAGLVSVENFAAVKLRKINRDQQSEETGASSAGVAFSTPTINLIHIKGRRKVRSRLINPTRASINSEDVFVLVTPTEIFEYVGAKANVMEKAKGAEIVQRIHQKKELGCKAPMYHTIEEGKSSSKESHFWEILGGKKPSHGAESVPPDELYERTLPTSWVMYEFHGEKDQGKFVAVHEKQTGLPKKEILTTDKIFLYDCGHEAYVWVGKQSTIQNRKLALQQARKIFDESCSMPDFAHMDSRSRPHSGRIRSKMTARKLSGGFGSGGAVKVKRCERPKWALFVRLNEGSETVMFKEKFADWPDESRIIKMKGHSSKEVVVEQVELKPCDISKMLIPQALFQGLVLEGDNIHRGVGKVEPHSTTGSKVISLSITKWLINETTRVVVSQCNHAVFHSGEGYVVRWSYRLCTLRKLEGLSGYDRRRSPAPESSPGKRADHDVTSPNSVDGGVRYLESGGRDKVAYFYWQGDDSSIIGKGTTAYSTVELDEEGASQIRVTQGKEPAAFRNIWGGAMITLLQKSDVNPLEHSNIGNVRLYEVSGQCPTEAALLQLKKPDDTCSMAACLRSRGCYALHDLTGCQLFVWKGVKASSILKQSAVTAAQKLIERLPGLQLIYIAEGEEPVEFWSLLGGKWKYPSLIKDPRKHDFTPRLFQLSSITQEFLATEVLHPCRSSDTMAFPFLQSDIYHASQPAIFLLDAHYEVYVWFGWWWKEQKEDPNSVTAAANSSTTGSRVSRWLRDKQLALETAQQYAKACTRFRTIEVYVMYAGTEHGDFTQHFPYWRVDPEVQQLNCQEAKPLPKKIYIDDELKKYTKMCYTLEELRQRPLPSEVDPIQMETYLTDKDFVLAFKKTREEYYKLPLWKQTALKKEAGLF